MRVILAIVMAICVSNAATAAPVWNGAAWYVVADTIVGLFVWTGPYSNKTDCEAKLPPDDDEAEFFCDYLTERPEWDD